VNKGTHPVKVNILEKEYLVACPENEEEALRASARYLNLKMKDIRDSGKVIGADRIAVMAALNMAHELLQSNAVNDGRPGSLTAKIQALSERIEGVLAGGRQAAR
jgi:cell division protein ZapA